MTHYAGLLQNYFNVSPLVWYEIETLEKRHFLRTFLTILGLVCYAVLQNKEVVCMVKHFGNFSSAAVFLTLAILLTSCLLIVLGPSSIYAKFC